MKSTQFLEGMDEKVLLRKLAECARNTGALTTFTMVNESTGATTYAYRLHEAGMADFFEKGKEMLLAPLQKGAIKADELKDKILAKLGNKETSKVMQAAKKYAKPALAFLLIGGAMLGGMDAAQASEMMQPGQELLMSIFQNAQEAGVDMNTFMDAARDANVNGQGIQAYAAHIEEIGRGDPGTMEAGAKNIINAILKAGQHGTDAAQAGGLPDQGSGVYMSDKAKEIMQNVVADTIKNYKG